MPAEGRAFRDQLLEFLRGGSAHIAIGAALEGFPKELRAVKPAGAPHNAWQLLEHTRLALHDILEFCTNSHYVELTFPEDYWPKDEKPPTATSWDESVTGLNSDLKAFEDLINDRNGNLYAEIPWGDGQTIFREVLLAGDHTSYHLGQIVFLRKQLEAQKK